MKISESNVRKIVREELLRLMEQEEPKAKKLDDLEFKSSERSAYEQWASSNGHISPEVQSVLVSYLIDQGLEKHHDLHDKLAKELGFSHDNIMAALENRLPKEEDEETKQSSKILDLERVVEEISKL
tara:strand:- start:2250 stop:2630 length:381 start_codon:yes stop_codon:yes gene_type:complete